MEAKQGYVITQFGVPGHDEPCPECSDADRPTHGYECATCGGDGWVFVAEGQRVEDETDAGEYFRE